jgi:hypothetical protein
MVVARWTSLRCYLNGVTGRAGHTSVAFTLDRYGHLLGLNHRRPVGDLPGGLVGWFASDPKIHR